MANQKHDPIRPTSQDRGDAAGFFGKGAGSGIRGRMRRCGGRTGSRGCGADVPAHRDD